MYDRRRKLKVTSLAAKFVGNQNRARTLFLKAHRLVGERDLVHAMVNVRNSVMPDFFREVIRKVLDETHEDCPRSALRASDRNARVAVTLLGHEE